MTDLLRPFLEGSQSFNLKYSRRKNLNSDATKVELQNEWTIANFCEKEKEGKIETGTR